MAAERKDRRLPVSTAVVARAAVSISFLLSFCSPRMLAKILGHLAKSARPATYEEACSARADVLSVSLRLNALRKCLPRSIAIALLCRWRGFWPTWCVGVRVAAPFSAHAWVEAEGRSVAEFRVSDAYAKLLQVQAGTHNRPASNQLPADGRE
ncbi:lasso peptide biosynthesis B2 protein [Streptomyces sp. NPDC054863]